MSASWKRNPQVRVTELGEGLLLLDARTRRVFELNPTGAIVWHSIEAGLETVVVLVAEEFSIDEPTARRDVAFLVDGLTAAGLLLPQP